MQQVQTVLRLQIRGKPLSNKNNAEVLGATVLGPGDFPLGSLASRAAARIMLQRVGVGEEIAPVGGGGLLNVAVIQVIGVLDHRPIGRLAAFIAVRPIACYAVIAARIEQFKATTAATGPVSPTTPAGISDLIDNDGIGIHQGYCSTAAF